MIWGRTLEFFFMGEDFGVDFRKIWRKFWVEFRDILR